jgi:uncharacterized protein (UPF0332 family)
MNLEKIKWCMCQKKGIELIDLNLNLSKAYIDEADETLENVFLAKGKWKIITSYYACYNALYSILMKCGIKSEIHECTIELMYLYDFDEQEINFLKNLKEDRIKVQYYLKKIDLKDESKVKKFILKCKIILNDLNNQKIEHIRKLLVKNNEL